MTTRAAAAGVLALAVAAAACARPAARTPEQPAASAGAATTGAIAPLPLTVENRHQFDVNVYVTRDGGQRLRLGTVIAATTRSLVVPPAYTDGSGFRLVADPIGPSRRSTFTSERVHVTRASQRVVWTLESSLDRSTVAVY